MYVEYIMWCMLSIRGVYLGCMFGGLCESDQVGSEIRPNKLF